MPTNSESLNRELFRLLSKYKPKPLDAEGKATPVPDEADIFKFEFTKDGEEYGTVYVTLDEDRVLTVYFGDDVSGSPSDKTPGLDYDDTWTGLLHQLSAWRMTKGLRGFKTQNKDHVSDDMARRNHMRNKDKIAEGYYPMGKSRSYSDAVPSVKIVIEHSRVIEEGEQRYRNINRIFLENQDGERYLLDTKKPGIARVYARHIAEGGKVNDDRWSHIGSLCEEYQKMAGFVRATRNGQFNESAQQLVNEGIAHYESLRESLSRLTGKRGYNAYFENWTPSLMEDGTEENNLNELFVQETLDPRIESVMPILNRIHKKVSESVVDKEMNKLAEWADSLVEEESLTSNNPVGIPESINDHGPVTQAITRRILMQHPDLLQKYGPEKVGDAIDSVAEFVGDVEEIGGSDVSGWVKQVAQSLGGHEGVSEEVDLGQYDAVKSTHKGEPSADWEKNFREKLKQYGDELEQRQKEKEVDEGSFDPLKHIEKKNQNPAIKQAAKDVKRGSYADRAALMKAGGVKDDRGPAGVTSMEEDLDANQKRAGQLGPTEKVKNNNIGKLVGANENFINTVDQAVVSEEDEMAEGILDSIKNMFKPKDPTPVTPITSDDITKGYQTQPEFKAQIDQIAKQQGMTPQELIAQLQQQFGGKMQEGMLDKIKQGVGNLKQGVQTGKDEFKKAWDEEWPKIKQDWQHPVQAAMAKEGEMDEGAHTQHYHDANKFTGDIDHGDRPPTDWSVDPIEAGTDRIHQKISNMLKKLEKPKSPERDKSETDIGSTVLDEMDKSQPAPGRDIESKPGPDKEAKPVSKEKMTKDASDILNKSMSKAHDKKDVNESEERPYVCVHAKKGKCEVKASSSYQAAQKAAQKWGLKGTAGIDAHLADVEKDTSSLEESTDELARILQIMNHKR